MIPSSSSSPSPSPSSSSGSKKMRPGSKPQAETKWRTPAQERVYGRRLLDALRATASGGARAVKEAADSALALTARGRSRWSRAILLGGRGRGRGRRLLRLKPAGGKIRRGRGSATRSGTAGAAGGRKVGDRLRLLRRLVPGCRKLSGPMVLEEAADYVAALEMQVKAMRALADALSAASAAASAAAEPGRGV